MTALRSLATRLGRRLWTRSAAVAAMIVVASILTLVSASTLLAEPPDW